MEAITAFLTESLTGLPGWLVTTLLAGLGVPTIMGLIDKLIKKIISEEKVNKWSENIDMLFYNAKLKVGGIFEKAGYGLGVFVTMLMGGKLLPKLWNMTIEPTVIWLLDYLVRGIFINFGQFIITILSGDAIKNGDKKLEKVGLINGIIRGLKSDNKEGQE